MDSSELTVIPSTFELIRSFWSHLSRRRKRQLGLLLVLMVSASFAEVLSLGAILPFLAALTTPEKILTHPGLRTFLDLAGINTAPELMLPITVLFILAALIAGGMRLLLLYVNTKLSYAIGADFSYEIYRRTLYQPYLVHASRNSSQIISGITGKSAAVIQGLLIPVLTLISSSIIFFAISAALLSLDPYMALIAFIGFGTIYGVLMLATRRRLMINSRRLAHERTQVLKILQEGLGGIRDVLLDGSQALYCSNFRKADTRLRQAQASNLFIAGAPRYAAESLGMALIAMLAFAIAQQPGGIANAITMLGALALGAQRLLPVMQLSYSSVIAIRASRVSMLDALELLNQPSDCDIVTKSERQLRFIEGIHLRGLSFRYEEQGPWVLREINLSIPRGARVGFIGATGGGKSTLLDIIMGLLPPSRGEILIDNTPLGEWNRRAWQERIAHVPQSIYLSDGSIWENIAFGVPSEEIDRGRVQLAARRAQLENYIKDLPEGYDTRVGERGMRLSGGQRQRIAIARALYKEAEVIIFDEATSALDSNTERDVMRIIDGLGNNLTIMLIAHRLSTLKNCDKLIELRDGKINRIGTYEDIVNNTDKT